MEIFIEDLRVRDLIDENHFDDIVEDITYFGDNYYICDAIQEIADRYVDCYNSDLWEWAKDNEEWIEEAVSQFGIDGRDFDLIRLFQQGQCLYYSNLIYENIEEFIKYFAYSYIEHDLDKEYIGEDIQGRIDFLLREIDHNDRLSDIIDKVHEVIGGEK